MKNIKNIEYILWHLDFFPFIKKEINKLLNWKIIMKITEKIFVFSMMIIYVCINIWNLFSILISIFITFFSFIIVLWSYFYVSFLKTKIILKIEDLDINNS